MTMLHTLERLLNAHLASMQTRSNVSLRPLPPRQPGPPSDRFYMLPLPPKLPPPPLLVPDTIPYNHAPYLQLSNSGPPGELDNIILWFYAEAYPPVHAELHMTKFLKPPFSARASLSSATARIMQRSTLPYMIRLRSSLGLHPQSSRRSLYTTMVQLIRSRALKSPLANRLCWVLQTKCIAYVDQLNAMAVNPASVLRATRLALISPQKTVYTLKLAFGTDPTLRAFCNSVIQSGTFLGADDRFCPDINRRVDYFVDAAFVPPVRELAFNLICMAITEGVPQYQDKFNQFLDAVMALAPGDA